MAMSDEKMPPGFGDVVEQREDIHGYLFVNGKGMTHRVVPYWRNPTQPIPLRRKHR